MDISLKKEQKPIDQHAQWSDQSSAQWSELRNWFLSQDFSDSASYPIAALTQKLQKTFSLPGNDSASTHSWFHYETLYPVAERFAACSIDFSLAVLQAGFMRLRQIATLEAILCMSLDFGRIRLSEAVLDDLSHSELQLLSDSTLNRCKVQIGYLRLEQLVCNLPVATHAKPQKMRAPRPKVIYYAHSTLPYASSGYALRTHRILQALAQTQYQVRCYSRCGYPTTVEQHATAYTAPGQYVQYNRLTGRVEEIGVDQYIKESAATLEQVFTRETPAVVHAASNFLVALPALIAARRCAIPFIYEVRGLWEVTARSITPQLRDSELDRASVFAESFVIQNADHLLTLNSALAEELQRRGAPAERISLARNAVDVEQFSPSTTLNQRQIALGESLKISANDIVLGFIGSITPYEGLDDLLRACAKLKESPQSATDNFHILLVGDGKELENLAQLAAQLGISAQVHCVGRVSPEQARDYYSLIDITPFPRKPWEVCELVSPLKPFEAMAMQKAVLVSSVDALAEIIETSGEAPRGLVFEKGSIESLSHCLGRLMLDHELRAQLGVHARDWVRQHRQWQDTARSITAVYEEVLQR